MKKLIILILTLTTLKSNAANIYSAIILQNPPDTIVSYFTNIDLTLFKNLPVDSFVLKMPLGYTSMKVRGAWRTERASTLFISYPNGVYVQIYVADFIFMNPSNPNKLLPDQAWDINLFRKENIEYIKISKGSNCINGCENP